MAKKNFGFTIIELVIVIFIICLLFFIIASMAVTVLFGSKQKFIATENVNSATFVASKFVNELRNSTNGVDGSYPIGEASDYQFVFYSNAGGNGVNPNKIRYYLSGTNLYRGFTAPSGSPLIYNLSQEKTAIVQQDVTAGGLPIFYYYDKNYSGTENPIAQPVNINNIKYVRINLNILKQIEKNNPSLFSISAGSTLRNLKNNLGD